MSVIIDSLERIVGRMFNYMTPDRWIFGIVLPFILAMVVTTLVFPLIVRMAHERNMVDVPDARKLQKVPVPVLGGLAVFFGVVIGAGATSTFYESYALFTSIVALTMMMYIGMLDDMIGLSPVLRLVCEILMIAFVVKLDLTNINDFHGLFGIGKLPVYVSAPLCIISCCGIINAVNMIDGVDGLSSGWSVVACLCFGIVFCVSNEGTMTVMASLMAGALIPFFFHNVFGQKSKMFIGDSGTMMVGMLMSIFCMRVIDNTSMVAFNHPHVGVIAFCLSVLSVPVFDTVRVMLGRIMKGVSPFHPDKSHLHHLFLAVGFSHIGTSIAVISLNVFNILCWFVAFLYGADATGQFIVVFVVGFANSFGFHYLVRRMNHNRIPYRILEWLARKSHFETGTMFLSIRKFIDKI